MCYNNRETSHPPFFFHMFLHLYSWHCGMVACYLSCSRLAALSEADTRACGLAVRGMQQAIKQAQRPFNNVLGLVRGKCFASSPSLLIPISLFFLLSILPFFPCHCASAVLQTTNSGATVTFHFLTNHSLVNYIYISEPGKNGAVCVQFLLWQVLQWEPAWANSWSLFPRRHVVRCSAEEACWPVLFWPLFLTRVFFSNLCSPQDRVDSWWVAANAAYRLAVFCSDTAPKGRGFSVHHKHCQANCSHQRERSAGGVS